MDELCDKFLKRFHIRIVEQNQRLYIVSNLDEFR